jgi:hypothetical protein
MFELIMWLIVGIAQVISCLSGGEPTWVQYWCVYIVMMLNLVLKRMKDKY